MSLSHRFIAMALAAGLILPAAAPAAVVNYDFTGPDHGSLDWTLNGAAFVTDGGVGGLGYDPDRLRITSNGGGQNNSAWLNTSGYDFSAAWMARMRGQMSFHAGGGADGMGMHFHRDGLGANPSFEGSGLTGTYLSINVDSWQNSGEAATNSVEVWLSGSQLGFIDLGNVWESGPNVDRPFDLIAAYDGAGTLSVSFDVIGDAPGPTGPVNFAANLNGLTNARWGFSASTGGAAANHDVVHADLTASSVPEPGSASLLGCAAIAMGGLLRRRRRR